MTSKLLVSVFLALPRHGGAIRAATTLAFVAVLGCATNSSRAGAQPRASAAQAEDTAAIRRDLDRVRAATSSFRVLDSAVAAGYARDVPRCLAHAHHGAMGYHHANRALMDARVDVERPEILTYTRTEDGQYRLTGVEYVVPYSAVPRDATPPSVMGQSLRPSDALKIWYLHAWIWEKNPSGLFADWNPNVKC